MTLADPGCTSGFGDALRALRSSSGLSVDQVSARTRVRPGVLRDLEAGSTAASGGVVYARGHVRLVAQLLGADPAPLLAALDAEAGPVPPPPLVPSEREAARPAPAVPPSRAAAAVPLPRPEQPERRTPRWGLAALGSLTLLVAVLGVGALTGEERTPVLVPVDGPSAAAPPAASAPPPAAPAPPTTARLGIRAVAAASWVQVQRGEETLFEGTLTPGSAARDFEDATEVRVVIGNAAGVTVSCGTQRLAPAGGPGEVKRFTCRPGGLS